MMCVGLQEVAEMNFCNAEGDVVPNEVSRYLLTNKNKKNEILPLHLLYAGEIQKRTCGASITCWESTL